MKRLNGVFDSQSGVFFWTSFLFSVSLFADASAPCANQNDIVMILTGKIVCTRAVTKYAQLEEHSLAAANQIQEKLESFITGSQH